MHAGTAARCMLGRQPGTPGACWDGSEESHTSESDSTGPADECVNGGGDLHLLTRFKRRPVII